MPLDNLKLNKSLTASALEAGYEEPTEIQSKSMSRILGGHDLVINAPAGSGKTTAYVLAVLNKIKYDSKDEAPKFLILVPDQERVLATVQQFKLLSRRRDLRIIGLYQVREINDQINALVEGMDIVVAVPKQARAVYLELGLNLSQIQLFIVDDAEELVNKKMQLPVQELARSIKKTQHLVFTKLHSPKLDQMIAPFMKYPAVIEL